MAGENKQTLQIATLDGYPFTGVGGGSQTGRTTKGQNAAEDLQSIEGTITPTTAASIGSYYQLARLPSNVIVKSVEVMQIGMASTPTFTGDVTIGVSDSTIDGTQPANQVVPSGLTTPATNAYIANPAATTTGLTGAAALFATAQAIAGQTTKVWVDVTFLSGNFNPTSSMMQPLWQAAGYTQDPGGFFDIVVLATSANAGTMGTVSSRVRFSMPSG